MLSFFMASMLLTASTTRMYYSVTRSEVPCNNEVRLMVVVRDVLMTEKALRRPVLNEFQLLMSTLLERLMLRVQAKAKPQSALRT